MVILLNTNCCGGKGLEKWNSIKNHIYYSETTVLQANENELITKLKKSIESGETLFIAAGGDGTLNYLLNSLIKLATSEQLNNIAIGAVGIGSSNDFHKPFRSMIGEIPVCIDFQNTYLRDVGVITYGSDKGEVKKYFLINASLGITAEANNLFNKSDLILRRLKQFNTKTAILYSAIKTMMTYRNLNVEIIIDGDKYKTMLSNLGITKNPHFSGDFCYDSQVDYTNGKFDLHLAYDMNKFEVLNLMKALISNDFSKLRKTKSLQSDRAKITSENNFTVEYDGEVITTREVEFKILKNFIKFAAMEKAFEIDFINKIAENFSRSPLQRNKIHHTDAEIIALDNVLGKNLAVTMDTISEEIKFGLYSDPFLIGWMTVMVNMSDIAAVGAAPIGILISESFTSGIDQEYISKIQEGIQAACRTCNTFVLGGDISSTEQLSLTGCAIGMLEGKKFLSRVGCKPGDIFYSSGKLGSGNGFALQKIYQLKDSAINYRPSARLIEGKTLLEIANCCMDTSDGTISTLDQIMRLNNCGIKLNDDWENFVDEESANVCKKLNIPLWFLLAGYHGEFELIFSIEPDSESRLLDICKRNNWDPIKIGHAIDEPDLILNLYGKERKVDSSLIRNLAFQHSSDVKSYIKSLLDYDQGLRKSKYSNQI